MRKLLFFIHSLAAGGAERVAAELANHWAKKGWDVTVVTVASQAMDFYQLHPGINRVSLSLAAESKGVGAALSNNLQRIRALRRVLRNHRPEIAVSFMTNSNLILAAAASGLRSLVCIGSEHIYPPSVHLNWFWKIFRRFGYGWLDATTALTTESKAWLRRHTRARNVAVIPNAVNWPLSSHPPTLAPREVIGDARKILLAAGRFEPQKGFDLLVQAFELLAESHPDWDLVILGDGRLRQQLNKQIAAAHLDHRIKLPGKAGNIGDWYEAADLFVLSSRFEGFGNTLAEAMAYGVPVVSFDCDAGPRDIIRHGIDGLLVPPNDVAALAAALGLLMARRELRIEYGLRAQCIRQTFSMDRVASLWEALFDDALRRQA